MATKGFTLLEAIIVIALTAGLALMAAPLLGNRVSGDVMAAAAEKAANVLYEARSSAMTGRNDAAYGVHFEAAAFTLFEGAAYGATDEDNLTYDLPGSVTASTIAITGGGADIHFTSHKGTPTETGNITFSDGSGDTLTVSVNAAGMIHVQ